MPLLLATQSHVCHGYVGNRAATFPLQCLGWDVDCCNSVQFSNHTGYGMDKVFGNITSTDDLNNILKDLFSKEKSHQYNALLSGYLPNQMSVKCMSQNYKNYKSNHGDCVWLMDPVMGDEGQLYVSEDVVPEYRSIIFNNEPGLVNIITPNQFELELLCDKKIRTFEELENCLTMLRKYVDTIIVTSIDSSLVETKETKEGKSTDESYIYCVVSSEKQSKGDGSQIFRVPLLKSYVTGVGDLFSALVLDRIYNYDAEERFDKKIPFYNQINEVLDVIQRVLKLTQSYAPKDLVSKINSADEMKLMELRIIEARDYYDKPTRHDYRYICH
ncbi:hypothetical protein TBLA_0C01690 [Henningerozyma blattae CBS 6284]|uniref:pyridoxal kinase n=1 Tax=Henningerozyma blattae (strain ATCC 34711 / CBS 6284 / DSM 70876 / NBRC 10599 / NRRL Y-10934 / UCD 77-7) TaxID=1071380 RepID=I2H0T1_HENB6|nr:hypothetical protein TBLA_0C01690 [Tetrapisispora blattae CBS 6284]CCH59983.1 hypothetical protein TBLA_0C01690 [Tetrapisispora blattae CBS 6284]